MPTPRPDDYPSRGAWLFRNVTNAFDFWPMLDSISITQEHPEMVTTWSFEVLDYGGELTFENGNNIRVTFDGERIAVGHVENATETAASEVGPRVWHIEGQDYTAKLGHAIIKRKKKRKKEKARRRVRWILRCLERRVWNLTGSYDLHDIPDERLEAYDYFGNTVEEALQQIADELDMHFYVDLNNKFHMWKSDSEAAPFDLDNDDPDYATTFPYREWDHASTSEELANFIMVQPEKRKHTRKAKSSASISTYGRREAFLSDDTLHRKRQARRVAEKELAQRKDPEIEAHAVVHEPGLTVAQRINVVEGLWDRDEPYFITAIEISALDPHDESGEAYLVSHLTLTDRRKRKRRRRRRRRPGQTSDTTAYPLDQFSRTVAPPEPEEGDPITATPEWWRLEWGAAPGSFSGVGNADFTEGAVEPPVLVASSPIRWFQSVAGDYNHPWTTAPCGIGVGAWSGWNEVEQWVDLATVPAHPTGMQGIWVDIDVSSSGGGLGSHGGIVYVMSEAPTTGRTGYPVGIVPVDTISTVFIPAAAVPAEGERLWVGIGPNWTADYGSMGYYCGISFYPPVLDGQASSGRASVWNIYDPRWVVSAEAVPDYGSTSSPAKAPWADSTWPWELIGVEGSPTAYGIDGAALYVTGPGGVGWMLRGEREVEDQDDGPWSDVAAGLEIIHTTTDTGQGSIEVGMQGEGEASVGRVDYANGAIVALGPTSTVTEDVAWTADDQWTTVFDTRSNKKVRGKTWKSPAVEPAAWHVQAPMDETEDDADRMTLWIRAETGQTIRILRLRAMEDPDDGHRVVRELCGFANGTMKKFTTRAPYRPGTLRVMTNGRHVTPVDEWPDDAEYLLAFRPTAGMSIRNTYVSDQGTGEDED